jgi:hypothetical protein
MERFPARKNPCNLALGENILMPQITFLKRLLGW